MTELFPDLAPPECLPAISLWQPWASLWAVGRKKNETRHWQTSLRGRLLIHAAKRIETDIDPELKEIVVDQFGHRWAKDLPQGGIIGLCTIVGCVTTNVLAVDPKEYACGNYGPNRFAWCGVDHRLLKAVVPYRGLQSLFQVPVRLVPEVAT